MIPAKATRVAPRAGVALTGVFVFGLASVLTGCSATAVPTQSDGRVVISGAARLDEATDSVNRPGFHAAVLLAASSADGPVLPA